MTKNILFVDDDEQILNGLRRVTRPLREHIASEYAIGAKEALDIMSTRHFDMVVSDMKMPGLNGAAFLLEVKKYHPDVLRIVLSGHSEEQLILESLESAHQYLVKPCKPDVLKAIITRACHIQDLVSDENIKNTLSGIKSIPSLPQLYQEITEALKNPNATLDDVGEIINKDPAMCAKILQLVNSSFFGLRREVTTTGDAVKMLGINTVKTLALTACVFSEFQPDKKVEFSIGALWTHSIQVGTFAQCIADTESDDPALSANAFMAGMLHDIGKLLIATHMPDHYLAIQQLMKANVEIAEHEAEKEVMGTTHAQIAAYLLGVWGLPDVIFEAVLYHHEPSEASQEGFDALAAVHAANYIGHKLSPDSRISSHAADQEYLAGLGCLDRLPEWTEACAKLAKNQ